MLTALALAAALSAPMVAQTAEPRNPSADTDLPNSPGGSPDSPGGSKGELRELARIANAQLLDEVSLVVNDDIITLSTVRRKELREQRTRKVNNERERIMMRDAILAGEVEKLLRVQAGQDLGLPPELVARQIEGFEERFVEQQGGVIGASKRLELAGVNSREANQQWTSELYSYTWEQAVTGEGPNATGRVVNDRWVRPGRLRLEYEDYGRALRLPTGARTTVDVTRVGGHREQLRLQELLVSVARAGGPEPARERIFNAKLEAERGEDFDALVDRYSDPIGGLGVIALHETDLIVRANPEFAEFLASAGVDDVSPIYPVMVNDKIAGFRLIRVLDRIPPSLPAFDEGETQRRLREALLGDQDERRIDEALGQLFRSAYIWPVELRRNAP